MAITLETLASGDVNYISKHNANNTTIKAAIDALQLSLTGSATSVVNFPAAMVQIFGAAVGKFLEADVVGTDAGSAVLNLAAGTVWIPSANQARTAGASSLDFTGQSTNTYYTHMDSVGAWTFDTTATDAVHTILFTSPSTFTTITEPGVIWGEEVFTAAQTSAALGAQTFLELDDRLEAAEESTNGFFTTAVTVADVTLTTAEGMQNKVVEATGTLTGDRDLIMPTFESNWLIMNNTSGAFDLGVRTSAQLTSVVIPQGASGWVYCDGTDVISGTTAVGATQPYIMSAFKNTAPTSSERMLGHTFPDVSGLATEADLTASSVEAETAATSQTDFDILKNDVSFGTIRFAALGTVATFVSVTAQTFVQGDRLEIIAPGTADATLANIYFTIAGTRDT